jgi:hypothetical protein
MGNVTKDIPQLLFLHKCTFAQIHKQNANTFRAIFYALPNHDLSWLRLRRRWHHYSTKPSKCHTLQIPHTHSTTIRETKRKRTIHDYKTRYRHFREGRREAKEGKRIELEKERLYVKTYTF